MNYNIIIYIFRRQIELMGKGNHLWWVIVNDELHHVKEYSHLKPKLRPTAICPVCRQQVIMRLGKIRIFHAAHQPESVCSVTQPESALHLNTKIYLYKQLKKGNTLFVNSKCSGATHFYCDKNKIVKFISGWNDVEMEYSIEQYRPDIVLLRDSIPIGAIEVFVTHSLEPEKEKYLKELSIPWIEVDANSENTIFNIQNWKINQPLEYGKINSILLKKWNCYDCDKLFKKEKRKLYEEEAIYDFSTTAFRVVDFYYPTGKKYRGVYFARKKTVANEITELAIVENYKAIFRFKVKNLEQEKKNLKTKFDNFLKQKNRKNCIVDTHMHWQEVWNEKLFTNSKDSLFLGLFPERYSWSSRKQLWAQNAYHELDWNMYFQENVKYGSILRKCSGIVESKL